MFSFLIFFAGTVVEARCKRKKTFYKAIILSQKLDIDGEQDLFTVRYISDRVVEKGNDTIITLLHILNTFILFIYLFSIIGTC